MKHYKNKGLYDAKYEHDACGLGFIVNMKGSHSHRILEQGQQIIENLSQRSGSGAQPDSGDGSGIMTSIPDKFFRKVLPNSIELPQIGEYGVGLVFLKKNTDLNELIGIIDRCANELQLELLTVRKIKQNSKILGESAMQSEPTIMQIFIGKIKNKFSKKLIFSRELYALRKKITNSVKQSNLDAKKDFYIVSLSNSTVIYKGMLTPNQLFKYFPDISDKDYQSNFSLVHTRFATNTFPNWQRAQPFRLICHNGEINSLQCNLHQMKARENKLQSWYFRNKMAVLLPIIEPENSDSGCFDNALEFNIQCSKRSLAEAVTMMIPQVIHSNTLDKQIYDYIDFMNMISEPWDGPASICFADGRIIGAVLDRNGLRPARYTITHDDFCIFSSEAGVVEIPEENVKIKGRLKPGEIFYIDTEQQKFYSNLTLKKDLSQKNPYGHWIQSERIALDEIVKNAENTKPKKRKMQPSPHLMRMFHYTREHIDIILIPMGQTGYEPLGSMGNDTPLAIMSKKTRLLYDYFKQLFAQVTNPPIDSIREKSVMSLATTIGKKGNWLESCRHQSHQIYLPSPILLNHEMQAMHNLNYRGLRSCTIDCTYSRSDYQLDPEHHLTNVLEDICQQACETINCETINIDSTCSDVQKRSCDFLILTDRHINKDRVPIPMLLAVGSVHQKLIEKGFRSELGLIIESAEPREIHHFCTLLSFGADAINPYLAMDIYSSDKLTGNIQHSNQHSAQKCKSYQQAIGLGLLKVMAKMGISKLASYKGAQLMECIGIGEEVIKKCFTNTSSRIGGLDFARLGKENFDRHNNTYHDKINNNSNNNHHHLANPGDYQWRVNGEDHLWDPSSITYLQFAVRQNDYDAYSKFTKIQNSKCSTLRHLLAYNLNGVKEINIDEIEAVEAIFPRFASGAMSLGSISKETHETLAIAMNRLGGRSNSGEGGEEERRYTKLPGSNDDLGSKIKQVASGRFGVTIQYLSHANTIQIKMAQGAKPGEGGELPGNKVFGLIAKTRHSLPGVTLISPPPHHDIYSIEDLAQLIYDLKSANPEALISVKLVSVVGVGTIAAGVVKANADHITISGHDGGTGASPLTGIKHAGLPWELGIAETHQTLVLNNLRDRVTLQTDGQIKTARDIIIATMLGAEEYGFATTALINMGCIMMRVCHLNTCPVGIATQDPELRKKFTGLPEHVIQYFHYLAQDIRKELAKLGIRKLSDLVGRSDLLQIDTEKNSQAYLKSKLDLTKLLYHQENLSNKKTFHYPRPPIALSIVLMILSSLK